MNLFASMILQCFIRLVIYADQMIVRHQSNSFDELNQDEENATQTHSNEVWGIDNTVSIILNYLQSSLILVKYNPSKLKRRRV